MGVNQRTSFLTVCCSSTNWGLTPLKYQNTSRFWYLAAAMKLHKLDLSRGILRGVAAK